MMKLLDKFRVSTFTAVADGDGYVHVVLFKWYKPWTWRKGIRKGEEYIVEYETNFLEVE